MYMMCQYCILIHNKFYIFFHCLWCSSQLCPPSQAHLGRDLDTPREVHPWPPQRNGRSEPFPAGVQDVLIIVWSGYSHKSIYTIYTIYILYTIENNNNNIYIYIIYIHTLYMCMSCVLEFGGEKHLSSPRHPTTWDSAMKGMGSAGICERQTKTMEDDVTQKMPKVNPSGLWLMMVHDGWWWLMMVDDGLWWLMMVDDGFWWLMMVYDGLWFMMVDDGWWWFMMVDDGWWWLMMVDDGSWWLMVVDDGWWWLMMVDDGWWWLMMVDDGWWWLMMVDDGWWWLMMVDDGLWWFMMVDDGWWWFMLVDAGWWWFMMVYGSRKQVIWNSTATTWKHYRKLVYHFMSSFPKMIDVEDFAPLLARPLVPPRWSPRGCCRPFPDAKCGAGWG